MGHGKICANNQHKKVDETHNNYIEKRRKRNYVRVTVDFLNSCALLLTRTLNGRDVSGARKLREIIKMCRAKRFYHYFALVFFALGLMILLLITMLCD